MVTLRETRSAGFAAMLFLATCSPYTLPPASHVEALPSRLSELGAYSDLHAGRVAEGMRPYRPTFALWSDGATKRRWIRLPASAKIDVANVDAWRFPVGTELWKEFSVEGKRIETRVLKRISAADDGWAAMSYAWTAAQDEAIATPGGVTDALGTHYDIPSARTCMACHGGRPERVLGFGAIQLAHETDHPSELTLERLAAEERLTAPVPPVRVPGTAEDVAALGYLHANCGHCHNSGRPAGATHYRPPANVDFGLRIADLDAVASTHAYQTALRFAMGMNPVERHLVLQRMTREGSYMQRMPPLATEKIDPDGVAKVRAGLRHWTEATR